MPARQVWAFLTAADVRDLIEKIDPLDPGLVASQGRYLRGDPQLLVKDPAALERRESLPNQRRTYLFHRRRSADIVTHLQPAGPFEGWSQIDEERSDCIVIARKIAPPGELEPSEIYAHVTYWRAATKERKRPMFSIWASQVIKWLGKQLPRTSAKMIRIGPDALAQAKSGKLRLMYLYREIAP